MVKLLFVNDSWQEIFHTLQKNKLRSFLTGFGVFWGILILMVLLGVGRGLEKAVLKQYKGRATNSLWMFPGATSIGFEGLPAGRTITVYQEHVEEMHQVVQGIDLAVARNNLSGNYLVSRKNHFGRYTVFGTTDDYFEIDLQEVTRGRKLNPKDEEGSRKVATIGQRVASLFFEPEEEPLGQYILINGVSFRVVGIYDDGGDVNAGYEVVWIPFQTFQEVFNHSKTVDIMAVTAQPGVPASEVEAGVRKFFSRRLRYESGDEEALFIFNKEEEYKRWMGFFAGFRFFLWIVGIGTLTAGTVGVSNIMIVVVNDRKREIGIRKSIGATPWMIIRQILLESLVLTLAAGYAGIVLGTVILELVTYAMENFEIDFGFFDTPEIHLSVVFTATLVLVLAGTLSALIPARKAAQIRPVEALTSRT